MLIHSDLNNTNSIVCHLIIVRYSMKTSHWYFPWATTLHLCNMTGRGEKLQQLHCYHPFSDSRDIYLTKNHYENYSPKMVPIAKIWGSGSWTISGINQSTHNHSIMTSSNGNIFRVTGILCGKFTGRRWIPRTQGPVTRSFDVFFDLPPNQNMNKQLRHWWFETPSRSLWRHCNVFQGRSMTRTQSIPDDSEEAEPILSLLLPFAKEHGVIDDVSKDGTNSTALYVAVEKNRPVAIKLLLMHGANPWVKMHWT